MLTQASKRLPLSWIPSEVAWVVRGKRSPILRAVTTFLRNRSSLWRNVSMRVIAELHGAVEFLTNKRCQCNDDKVSPCSWSLIDGSNSEGCLVIVQSLQWKWSSIICGRGWGQGRGTCWGFFGVQVWLILPCASCRFWGNDFGSDRGRGWGLSSWLLAAFVLLTKMTLDLPYSWREWSSSSGGSS